MSVIPFPSPLSAPSPLRQGGVRIPDAVGRIPETAATTESRLALWLRRWRGRRALAALDRDQIRDADLDPFTVRLEAMTPFWRA
jgi:uncharacterized protein YjiS (DUF1127 family)